MLTVGRGPGKIAGICYQAEIITDLAGRTTGDLVSRVTDAVVEQMLEWQNRPLDSVYAVLLVDAIFVKIRDGQVANRPVHVAMGISVDGYRDILGSADAGTSPRSSPR